MDIQSFKQQILQHIQQSVGSFISLLDEKILSQIQQDRQTLIESTVSLLSDKILQLNSKQDIFKYIKKFNDNRVKIITDVIQKNNNTKYEKISDTFFTYIQQIKDTDNNDLQKQLDKLVPSFSINIPEEIPQKDNDSDLHTSVVSLFENNKKYIDGIQQRMQKHYEQDNLTTQNQLKQYYEQRITDIENPIDQQEIISSPSQKSNTHNISKSKKTTIKTNKRPLYVPELIKPQMTTYQYQENNIETKQQTEHRSAEWDKLHSLMNPLNKFVDTFSSMSKIWQSVKSNAKTIGIISGIVAAGGGLAYSLKQVWNNFNIEDVDDKLSIDIDDKEIEKMFSEGRTGDIESIVERKQYQDERLQQQSMFDSSSLGENEVDLMNSIKQWGLENIVRSKQGIPRKLSKESLTEDLKETFQYMGKQGQWTITAAKEEGHAAGKYSHSSGDKLDISTRWKSPEQIAALTVYMINKGYRPVYEYNAEVYSRGEAKVKQGGKNLYDNDIHTYVTVQTIKQYLHKLNVQRTQKMLPSVELTKVASPMATTEHLDVNLRKDIFGKENKGKIESFVQPPQQSFELIENDNQYKVKQKNEHQYVQSLEQQMLDNKQKLNEKQQQEFSQQIAMQSVSQLFESTVKDPSLTKVVDDSLDSAYKATRHRTYIK